MVMTDYDVLVAGGGAAGLSAALVLSRARRRVLVVDEGRPRNAPAAHLHGFLSRDGMVPSELLRIGRLEAIGYGATITDDVVTRVARISEPGRGFAVRLGSGSAVTARRLLVATGLRDELPDIAGLGECWARDVLHCPYCHGYEVKDQRLGVLGGAPGSVGYAQIVRQWSSDVVFFTHPLVLTSAERGQLTARGIVIVETPVRQVAVRDDRLHGLVLDDGSTLERDALFVLPRPVPNGSLLVELGCTLDEDGWAVSERNGLTTTSGVWVAGNVAGPRAQVITAAGEGSAAAIAINADLVEEDVRTAVLRSADVVADRCAS